ncbi:MAG: glycine cleavage system aminomethyltransferase GcvT [Eubacteriales bacterium]|nr:glycine cleavage system aminomethyltransferase GcvT [Eubacteriales bacterium]
MANELEQCKKTPLYETHLALGGRMVDFGGWALPVQYSSILEEHKAVRERVGLFDVSHMGELMVEGADALAFLNHTLTNDFTNMQPGRCRYAVMCYPDGGAVDDVLVYKFDDMTYLVVVNASNTDKDFLWLSEQIKGFQAEVRNESDQWAQVALQGPKAEEMLKPLAAGELPQKNYTFVPSIDVCGIPCIVSRTGYTGEDGFELYCKGDNGPALHQKLMEAGAAFDMLPCGLGARDTLRFEASMPLYGHELNKDITPRECGLDFAIKLQKNDFIGKAGLVDEPKRKRIGLKLLDRGVAREHMDVQCNGELVGHTTSGGPAPTLGGSYAMALVTAEAAKEQTLDIMVRGKALKAEVVALPFYKRAK